MTTQLYFVHALSPLHAGTGQGSGVIDLPIAREKASGLPYLPGSSVKGVLRDRAGETDLTYALFGPKTENASDHAGALQIADARLLLLPVRALRGTFAYVTSPYILRRFARDASDAGFTGMPGFPALADGQCAITEQSKLGGIDLRRGTQAFNGVVLEDLDLEPHAGSQSLADQWANWLSTRVFPTDDAEWPTLLRERLCMVSDDVLRFLLTTAIEVIARNRLDDATKTVVKGALWYEEALPAESVLYGLATLTPTKQGLTHYSKQNNNVNFTSKNLLAHLNAQIGRGMQFGGKATVGRGLCRVRLVGKDGK